MRELTCEHANKHWNKFGYHNYKINKRCFRSFCDNAGSIWKLSPLFNKLPATWEPPAQEEDVNTPKKRTRTGFELSSPEGKPRAGKKAKIVCLLSDSEEET